MKKDGLHALSCIIGMIILAVGLLYCATTGTQYLIDARYKTGVTITSNPEYQIELFYSADTCTPKDILTLRFKPRLFKSRSVIVGNYKIDKAMHLWHWTITRGDHTLYGETIDRDVKAGDNIQFIYVVD